MSSTSGNSNQILWLISDASKFLDLPSTSLNFDYKCSLTGAPIGAYVNTLPSDNAVSLFSRIQVKIGGINCEDITNLSQFFNTKMVISMNKPYYEKKMTVLAGSYVWNSSAYGGHLFWLI